MPFNPVEQLRNDGDTETIKPKFTPLLIQKWQAPLPLPPVKQAEVDVNAIWTAEEQAEMLARVADFQAPELLLPGLEYYHLDAKRGIQEIIPGIKTEIWGYDGQYPGPTYKVKILKPSVVRIQNSLHKPLSLHVHGGHQSSHADGHPTDFDDPGSFDDYVFHNSYPIDLDHTPDESHAQSTIWYHNHSEYFTDESVFRGLAGFWLTYDNLELELIRNNILPGWDPKRPWNEEEFFNESSPYDIPLLLQSKRFNADGSLFYEEEPLTGHPMDPDGTLGDVSLVNGKAYPYFVVEPRKYRFRILNGDGARYFRIGLNDNDPSTPDTMLRIAQDRWLYDYPIETSGFDLTPAQGADVIIDFSNYTPGSTIYLENSMQQDDGRGPDYKTMINPDRLVKFVVQGTPVPDEEDAKVDTTTFMRPFTRMNPSDATVTRHFRLERSNGMWLINGLGFDHHRDDATIQKGAIERWVFENKSGGWSHPMHIHLEGHQVQSINGQPPPKELSYFADTTDVGPNDTVEMLVHFRTYTGRFMFHCHNTGHEDIAMMATFNVVDGSDPVESHAAHLGEAGTQLTGTGNPITMLSAALMNPRQKNFAEGTSRNDILDGTSKPDLLIGFAGQDQLRGRIGNDELYGHDGDDWLAGGDGHDRLCLGKGSDRAKGGKGRDLFVFNSLDSNPYDRDIIIDFDPYEDGDRLMFKGVEEISDVKWLGGELHVDIDGDDQRDFLIELQGVDTFCKCWLKTMA